MAAPLYKITFEGQLLPGIDPASAIRDLALLFEASEASVEQLFNGRKLALKRHLLLEDTHKFVPMLEKAGIQTRVEDDTPFDLRNAQTLAGGATYDDVAYSPWTTPASSDGQAYRQVEGERKHLSLEGRMGRINFAAWTIIIGLIAGFTATAFMSAFAAVLGSTLTTLIVTLGYLAATLVIGVRRLHDINWSGWLVLLSAVPYVGLILSLILLFKSGTPGGNRFGPQPEPATSLAKWFVVIAGVGVILMVVGLVWFVSAFKA